uniref:Uncharacterized protein n=1 Tax=Avena sativa TaxID=4498 RepID=A0ACD5ZD26_AVESA
MVGFRSKASMEFRLGPRRRSSRLLDIADRPDLISTLPDDLLLLVLARLPCASAAARTGVLSRRWRGLWARLRRIVFSEIPFHSLEPVLARISPPPPAVSLLEIRLPKPRERVRKEHRADTARLSSLLCAAARIDPEELFLVIPSRFVGGSLRLVLPCFHRATSIRLEICSNSHCVPAGVEFPALETLSLSNCKADLDAFLSRCPRLRTLQHANVRLHKAVLRVNSPLLQELVVDGAGTWMNHVNIVAPVLTQLTMSLHFYHEGGISVLAPMVEKVSYSSSLDIEFGLWTLRKLSLQKAERQGHLPSLHIHACIRSTSFHGVENITEIEKHMIAEFIVLELHLDPKGHVFGALAFHLLGMNQVCSTLQRLNVILKGSTMKKECPLGCPCEPLNWRSQTISLNALEEVEINGFDGDDHEIDFLRLIFKCAPMLKTVTVKLSHEVSSRNDECTGIYDIFRAYSSVQCYVYLNSGFIHGSQTCPST